MTILAHISDLHLLERDHAQRSGIERTRLAYLSGGASLDAHERITAARSTLMRADRSGADHIVITGDLTEDGSVAQFETLADVLHSTGISSDRVTIVPGNHDGYSDGCAGFFKALAGPLSAYRGTSAPGAVTVLQDAVIQPISTVIDKQWVTDAGGVVRDDDLNAIAKVASDGVTRRRTHVVAQHHPVTRSSLAASLFDGTRNGAVMQGMLLERHGVHVLHGHVHKETTRALCDREHAQVFSTSSVRDGGKVLRLYKAEDGHLRELSAPEPAAARTAGVITLGRHPVLAAG